VYVACWVNAAFPSWRSFNLDARRRTTPLYSAPIPPVLR
jgi:hypothetical protein